MVFEVKHTPPRSVEAKRGPRACVIDDLNIAQCWR
jgi:hypothetical protein